MPLGVITRDMTTRKEGGNSTDCGSDSTGGPWPGVARPNGGSAGEHKINIRPRLSGKNRIALSPAYTLKIRARQNANNKDLSFVLMVNVYSCSAAVKVDGKGFCRAVDGEWQETCIVNGQHKHRRLLPYRHNFEKSH